MKWADKALRLAVAGFTFLGQWEAAVAAGVVIGLDPVFGANDDDRLAEIGIFDEISDILEIDTGMPHSAQFHLVERIHLSPDDPNVLINEMRMEDPQALEEPFEITVRYRRDRHGTLIEFQCAENDRNPVGANGDTEFE